MSSSTTTTSAAVERQDAPSTSLARPLQIVFGVAFLLATLFTAWTEPGLLPGELANKLGSAISGSPASGLMPWPTLTPRPQPTIGLVAGHSGYDSGAVCPEALGSFREVDINQSIANLVQESLVAQGYDVDMLTEFDPHLNDYRALALISIHSDSCDYINDEATGYKVAAAMSTLYQEQSIRLTNCLIDRYGKTTGLPFHAGSVTNDMTEYHAFGEIDKETPAAIIEVGFMNLDRDFLTQQPQLAAQGITAGIMCFINNENINSGQTP